MSRTIRMVGVIILIFTTFFLWRNELLLPIVASLSYAMVIGDYVLRRRNLKTGKYFAFIREKNTIFPGILWPVFGGLYILWGLLTKDVGISFKGIDSKVFIGVFFLISGIFHLLTPKTILLLTDKSIVFNGAIGKEEWNYKKLDKIIINEKEIVLLKGTASETFSIENAEKDDINSIYNFLLPKLDNRIFKEV